MTPNYGPAITGIPARRKTDGPRLSVYRDIPGHNRYVWSPPPQPDVCRICHMAADHYYHQRKGRQWEPPLHIFRPMTVKKAER